MFLSTSGVHLQVWRSNWLIKTLKLLCCILLKKFVMRGDFSSFILSRLSCSPFFPLAALSNVPFGSFSLCYDCTHHRHATAYQRPMAPLQHLHCVRSFYNFADAFEHTVYNWHGSALRLVCLSCCGCCGWGLSSTNFFLPQSSVRSHAPVAFAAGSTPAANFLSFLRLVSSGAWTDCEILCSCSSLIMFSS